MALGLGLGLQFRRNTGGGFNGLFDQFGYPAFGASMRLLGKNYTGGLVRVRAFDGLADQGTADVMPYKIGGEFWVDLNSTLENLDATAIGRGLTTSDTLGDLLSSGVSNYDGFITTWFDQSGNANDVSQGAAANQPQIASAGSLIIENGKPAVDFLPSTTTFLSSPITGFSGTDKPFSAFNVYGNISGDTFDRAGLSIDNSASTLNFTNIGLSRGNLGVFIRTNTGVNRRLEGTGSFSLNSQVLHSIINLGTTGESFLNSNLDAGPSDTSGTVTRNTLGLGAARTGTASPTGGWPYYSQEYILYNVDKSADRTSIETNINTAFSIYP